MNHSRRFHRRQTILTWLTVLLLVLLQVQFLPTFSVTDPDVIADGNVIASSAKQSQEQSAVQANYGKLPLAFEPNQGQVDGAASFLVHHGQATTYFDGANTTTTVGDSRVTMSLDGATTPSFKGTNQLESKTNYFIGNDQSKWHSDVPNFKSLLAKNVYPGIDLKYYGTNSQLEHDFIVSPGTNYKQISFHFDGQEDVSLDKDGNLILKTGESELHLNAPITYQETTSPPIGGSKHTIPSQFELKDNIVTVSLNADYDHSQSLIIDPVLVYSTYLGGSNLDHANGIAVDASGNVYVSGYTASTDFPTSSPFQASNINAGDAFITKLNAAGSALVYSTYLGGSNGDDFVNGIAVDASGNAYVSGYTASTNFPTNSPFQGSNAGNDDAFVAKLNNTGSALVYSTYLGGGGNDRSNGIAVDANSNAYVVGFAISTNFPTSSPFQGSNAGSLDAFITKFDANGAALVYSTYLGGTASDQIADIAVDANGNAYASGFTTSTNFPTASPFQGSNAGGGGDVFVVQLDQTGSALVYSTYLGGTASDQNTDIAVDSSGNAYITGGTNSTNFPTSSPYQVGNAGSNDAFVTKLNATGSALVYSTYLGGTANDFGHGIAIDASGNAYIFGQTNSTNFPTASPFQASNGGSYDDFVTKLNAAGSAPSYSTYLGGAAVDGTSKGIVIGASGNAYVAGFTQSTNFPTSLPYQASYGGFADAFVTQLTEHSVNLTAQVNPTLTFTVGSTSCSLGALSVSQTQFCTYALTASTNGTSGYTISYLPVATLTSGGNTITALSALTASTLNTEQFGINLRANTAVGSHTASAFGADVSGGSGVVAAAYNTDDSFKLVAAGDTVSSAPSPSLTSTYTVSTIANIGATTEAGAYTTTLTYNIVAGY